MTILTTYEETVDLHEEYDIWQEEDFLSLPLLEVNSPDIEKLTGIVANTKVAESAYENLKPTCNWLGSWTTDPLRQWQDEDSSIKKVKTWKIDSTHPKWTNN